MYPKVITKDVNDIKQVMKQYEQLLECSKELELQIHNIDVDIRKKSIPIYAGCTRKLSLEKVQATVLSTINLLHSQMLYRKGVFVDEVI